jgi:hypothetical protein
MLAILDDKVDYKNMGELEQQIVASNHPPEDLWGALNTPLLGEFDGVLQPIARAHYTGLSDRGKIQLGTLMVYELDADAMVVALRKEYPLLPIFKSKLPKDIALRVKEHDPEEMVRVDVLESRKHEATLRQRVQEAGNGTSLLIVEGELALGGSFGAAQDMLMPLVQTGIKQQGHHILGHLLG